ncbi:MAG TPA: histidine kinase [Thermoanaerobaculia bacterium]|nr:histidine kinase [Thermoanaerobaculia bacterium]
MGQGDAQNRGDAHGGGGAALSAGRMSRRLAWLWLLTAWLPLVALFTALVLTAHPQTRPLGALLVATRLIVAAALLGLLVYRLTARLPWPHPLRAGFLLAHLLAAPVYAVSWWMLNNFIQSVVLRRAVLVIGPGVVPFLVVGAWLYLVTAGVAYATREAERAARAEAMAARSQLAALRAQLHPHFLFNALHTVVQLIPREPGRAAAAAERLAGLLRTAVEEDRDLVSLAEEWAFVESYLEIERVRMGERLRLHLELTAAARAAAIPAFALQTLVENAVRHGAAPRVEPTDVTIAGREEGGALVVTVRDNGAGASAAQIAGSGGTGLERLRERLAALTGGRGRLEVASAPGGGFTATLVVPQEPR